MSQACEIVLTSMRVIDVFDPQACELAGILIKFFFSRNWQYIVHSEVME